MKILTPKPKVNCVVSAEVPDWSRESKSFWAWDPGRSLLAALRDYQRHRATPRLLSPILRPWAVVRHHFWQAVSGADIPLNCRIDGGLLLPHPNGVVVHPDARIGPNCLLFQQVTIGSGKGGAPQLGGHVDIGAGAKVLGGVVLGNHCKVGANAVVLSDVAPGATVVGIPAKVVSSDG